jgi:hypothetical protein
VPAANLWLLAETWYDGRLSPDWKPRPRAASQQLLTGRWIRRAILVACGLIWGMNLRILAISAALVLAAVAASAQSFEASVHLASSQWSEFDGTDIGGGGRLTFKPTPTIGVDADLTWYPGEFPPDGIPFTGNRSRDCLG